MTRKGRFVFVSSTVFEGVLRRSVFKEVDLRYFHSKYHIPSSVTQRAPRPEEVVVVPSGSKKCVFMWKS
ncbi:hypothetical protein SLA2020_378380 [Shorea laevis]